MGRRFIPATIVVAVAAMAVSAGSAGMMLDRPRLWSAAVALAVLGGITPMIYAVNARILPVFSRRDWRSPEFLMGAMTCGVVGAWSVFAARATGRDGLETVGMALALAGALGFSASVGMLFRSEIVRPAPPMPYEGQAAADRTGIAFTRLAGIFLLVGMVVGVALTFWTPSRGRWDLVWAHSLLLGWFVNMASGVAYHTLPRWGGGRWRTPQLLRVHLILSTVALPLMLVALAINSTRLFTIAAPLQALAFVLLAINVVPLAARLAGPTRLGYLAAISFLMIGSLMGAMFAHDATFGARMRIAHAEINLFGWAGLLICGVGYYLFPRLFGSALRWPRLAYAQVALSALGVIVVALGWWWLRYQGESGRTAIQVGGLIVAGGLSVFAVNLIATLAFRSPLAMISPRSIRTVTK